MLPLVQARPSGHGRPIRGQRRLQPDYHAPGLSSLAGGHAAGARGQQLTTAEGVFAVVDAAAVQQLGGGAVHRVVDCGAKLLQALVPALQAHLRAAELLVKAGQEAWGSGNSCSGAAATAAATAA